MGNIALQIERSLSGNLVPESNVIFDLVTHSTGNINYDNNTGIITFMETGRYVANWFVITKSSNYANGVVLSLVSPNGNAIKGNSNVKTGEVVGFGIIEVTTVPTMYSLKNTSAGNYYFPDNIPVKASLIITQDTVAAEPVNAHCFAIDQLINILSQMITAYSTTTWTVYSESLSSFSGMPFELYTSPNADKPGILRLIDVNNDYEAIPLEHITAIYPGDGTIYDPGFTYLTTPDSIIHDCNYDLLSAIQSYIPVGTTVELRLGPAVSASGDVYQNEYGVVVLSDAGGNTPVFIASPNILRIFTTGNTTKLRTPNGKKDPNIEFLKK